MIDILDPSTLNHSGTRMTLTFSRHRQGIFFYLQDTSLGKDWRVVQKFKHRDMYDMNEIELVVHQDDHCSNNEHEVLLGDGDQVMHEASHGGEGTIIQANLEDLRDKREAVGILEDNEDEDEDEDDTRNQYCSDDSNYGGRDHMSKDNDDL